jgi:hypothetical protein
MNRREFVTALGAAAAGAPLMASASEHGPEAAVIGNHATGERGPLPVLYAPPNAAPHELDRAQEAMRRVRAGERGMMLVLPTTWRLEWHDPDTGRVEPHVPDDDGLTRAYPRVANMAAREAGA